MIFPQISRVIYCTISLLCWKRYIAHRSWLAGWPVSELDRVTRVVSSLNGCGWRRWPGKLRVIDDDGPVICIVMPARWCRLSWITVCLSLCRRHTMFCHTHKYNVQMTWKGRTVGRVESNEIANLIIMYFGWTATYLLLLMLNERPLRNNCYLITIPVFVVLLTAKWNWMRREVIGLSAISWTILARPFRDISPYLIALTNAIRYRTLWFVCWKHAAFCYKHTTEES